MSDSVYADESEELLDALQPTAGQEAPQTGQTQPETGQEQPEAGHRYEENETAKPMTRFEVKDGQAEVVAPVSKKCVMCMEEKPIEEFSKRNGYYDDSVEEVAYSSRCKKCVHVTTYMAQRYQQCKDQPYHLWTPAIKEDVDYVIDCYNKGGDINYGRGRVAEIVQLSGLALVDDGYKVEPERKTIDQRLDEIGDRLTALETAMTMLVEASKIGAPEAPEPEPKAAPISAERAAIIQRIRADEEIFTKVFGSDESERSRFCDEFLPALFQRADTGRCDLTDIVGLTAPFAAAQTNLPQDLVAELDTATSKEFRERWYGFDDAQKAEVLSAFEECNLPNVYLDGFAAVNKQ